jgi:hypothetical protein
VIDLTRYRLDTGEGMPIPFAKAERELYRSGNPETTFHHVRWALSEGRGEYGEFSVVVD